MLESSKAVMETLLSCLVTHTDENIRGPIVDNLTPFFRAPEHIELAISWINKRAAHLPGSQDKIFELNNSQVYALLKRVHKSSAVSDEVKAELLEKVIGEDKSDVSLNTRLTCKASSADPAVKAECWRDLTSAETKCSLHERSALMAGFWCSE